MRAGHRLQHQRGIHHRARHRRHVGVVAEGVGDLAVRDDAVALLQADHAVGRRRDARRAAAVGGDADRPDAGRHRDRGAAARAARGALGAPGVARAAEQRRVGQRLVAELRGRRLAEQDGAGGLHARARRPRLPSARCSSCMQRAEGRAHAGGVHEILGGEGDAVQQAERLALHDRILGLLRGGQRLVGDEGDEAVQHRLQLLRARQHGFGQLDRRDFLGGDLLAQHRSGQAAEVVGHSSSPRAARLRISADTPNVQGAILSQWFTRLVSVPSLGERIETRSPTMWVKPAPPGVRGFGRREQRAGHQHHAVGILVRAGPSHGRRARSDRG